MEPQQAPDLILQRQKAGLIFKNRKALKINLEINPPSM